MADVELNLVSDTREAQAQYGSEMPDAIQKMADALDDVAANGEEATESLESGFRDVLEGAGDASNAVDEVAESADSATLSTRSIGTAAKEAISGDLSGSLTAATGLLRGFGPVGAVAGGIAAGAIGLVTAALGEAEAKTIEQEAAAAQWAQAWLDAGGSVITSQQLVAEVREISTDPERYKIASQNAEDWGVTVSTAMRAMAGDTLALTAAQTALNERTAEAARLLAIQEVQVDANAGAAYDLDDATRRGAESLDALYAGMEAGREIAAQTSDALLEIVQAAGEAGLEVDELGNKLYTLPDGTKVVVNAETGQASQNIETFKGDLDGIVDQVDTTVVAKVTADMTAVDRDLARSRTLRVNLEGFTRNGQRVI